jgi:hypothetical protein
VDAFHREWRGYFTPLIFRKASLSSFESVPRFRFEEESTSTVAARVAIGVLGLLVPAGLLAWGGARRLGRYAVAGGER